MAKVVPYTEHETEIAVSMYMGVRNESDEARAAVVEEIGAILGKDVRSVRAKLARERTEDGEQVYIAKTPKAKDGGPVMRKDAWAEKVLKVSGLSLTSIDNLTREDMKKLVMEFERLHSEVDRLMAGELESSDDPEDNS